ncbi:UNVERIFIED_ORG: hypothetical protein M2348_001105 [Sphingomonas sp. R1F5B]
MMAVMDDYAGWREDADLRRHIAKLPAPAALAAELPPMMHDALRAAWRTADGWRVASPHHAQLLRMRGLCDIAKPLLTVLGIQVRAVIMGQD